MASPLADLKKLQQLDLAILSLKEQLADPPRRLGERRDAVHRAKADLEAKKAEIKETQKDLHELEVDLQDGEEKLERNKVLLNQAKTNDEYSTLQSQIETITRKNGKVEEAILEKMDRVDALQEELAAAEAAVEAEEAALKASEGEVEAEVARLGEQVEGRIAERNAMAEGIDAEAVKTYERILEKRTDGALAVVEGKVCQGCFTRLPPQWINLIQIDKELVTCPQCGRIVYLAESG